MAFALSTDRELPQHCTVASYTVERLGAVPTLVTRCAETVDLMESPVYVESVTDNKLAIPAWAGRTDLVGRSLYANGVIIGQVASTEPQVLHAEDPTVIVSPFHAVLVTVPTAAIAGTYVTTLHINATGAVSHRVAQGGRTWESYLPMQGAGATRAQGMLVGISINLVRAVLDLMGDTATSTAAIQAAVVTLAHQGTTIDSMIGNALEALELERQAGLAPYISTAGQAPRAATPPITP